MPNGDKKTQNVTRRMRKMIEEKDVDSDAAILLLMESNLDVLETVETIYDLPLIKLLIFAKNNKKTARFFAILFVIAFEIWHVKELRDVLLQSLSMVKGWFK